MMQPSSWAIPGKRGLVQKPLKGQIQRGIQRRQPFFLFFRGGQKILSVLGRAAFARLTPWPNSWHDRGMKVSFISIFRRFPMNPLSEPHTPDSPDSLIFCGKGRKGNREKWQQARPDSDNRWGQKLICRRWRII
jgi:hypothetical protein